MNLLRLQHIQDRPDIGREKILDEKISEEKKIKQVFELKKGIRRDFEESSMTNEEKINL